MTTTIEDDGLNLDQLIEANVIGGTDDFPAIHRAGLIGDLRAALRSSPAVDGVGEPVGFEWTDAMYGAFNAIQAQKSHPYPEQLLAAWRALHEAAIYSGESGNGDRSRSAQGEAQRSTAPTSEAPKKDSEGAEQTDSSIARSALSPTSDRASVVEECAKVADLEIADAAALLEMHEHMSTDDEKVRTRIAGRLQSARHIAAAIRALSPRSS